MLTIPARTIYIDPAIRDRPACHRRLEAMLPHFDCDDVRDLLPGGLEEIRAIGHRRHGKDDFGDDCVVAFTAFEPGREGWFYHFRDAGDFRANHGGYCQSAVELNIVAGCAFRCAYCGFGRYLIFNLDVERFIAGLDDVFAAHPRQRLWKFSNMTDLPAFEGELDAVAPVVRRFAAESDRYLMLFTKSDNVDFLLDLPHGGRTIVSWSLSAETASRHVDKRTATLDERIEAMRKCQAAGYLVRARLSPIVPVRNWRAEYREVFERLFAACSPDVVTLELLGWFDLADLAELLPRELTDDSALAAAESAAEELTGVHWGPFPEGIHQGVYRYCIETVRELSPKTPVAVCHGTDETWDALGGLMGMSPDSYICNCGGDSTPGGSLYGRLYTGA